MIFTLELLLKQEIQHGIDNEDDFLAVLQILEDHLDLHSKGQVLAVVTLINIKKDKLDMDPDYLNIFNTFIDSHPIEQEPEKYLISFFDA